MSSVTDKFRLHLGAFVVGTLTTIASWTMIELESVGGWPNRLNDNDQVGSWERWSLWILLAWGSIVGVHALITYLRPTTPHALPRGRAVGSSPR